MAGREAEAGTLLVHLDKRIPHGAGLGGGSSDAAAMLRILSVLLPGWHTPAVTLRMAAELGSDVPFFLVGGTALGEERGDVLTPLPDAPAMPVTIVMPAAHVPTPQVFAAMTDAERGPRAARGLAAWRELVANGAWTQVLYNRLTEPAIRCCPVIGEVLSGLRRRGVLCAMSGSGAASFALAHITEHDALDGDLPARCLATRFVTRAEAVAAPWPV